MLNKLNLAVRKFVLLFPQLHNIWETGVGQRAAPGLSETHFPVKTLLLIIYSVYIVWKGTNTIHA